MSRNTQLTVATHILVSLTLRGERLNSDDLAWSIGTNASLVRRLLAALSRAGLVSSRPGRGGGVELSKDARDISLLEVLNAVEGRPSLAVHTPNPECPLGAVLSEPLQVVADQVENAAEDVLASWTVRDVARSAAKLVTKRARASRRSQSQARR